MGNATGIAGAIYLVTNLTNGKKYVGQTKLQVMQRWAKHLGEAKRGKGSVLHSAIRKYGAASFRVEQLRLVYGAREDLLRAEVEEIAAQDSCSPKGYNLTRGGDGVDFTLPEVRATHRKAVQQLAKSPKWLENNRKRARELATDPAWRKAQKEGTGRKSSDPQWLKRNEAQRVAMLASPAWQEAQAEGSRKRSSTKEWKEKNALQWERVREQPGFQEAHAAGMKRMSSDPDWQRNHAEMVKNRSNNPKWKEGQALAIQMGCAANKAKALARDARATPEEVARREKRRASVRKYRLKKKLALKD
jgi:hypothetical protein